MRYGVVCTSPTGELSLDLMGPGAGVSVTADVGVCHGWAGSGGGDGFELAALSFRLSLPGISDITAWKDQSGRPRHEMAGRALALAGVLFGSVAAPASGVFEVGNSNLGRLDGGSRSCDSGPAVRSTTVGCRIGCGSWAIALSRPTPLNVRKGWPHGWPPAEEWGFILGSWCMEVKSLKS